MEEIWFQSLGQEGPLEKGMATHSSILAWTRIPWTEEPGGLQSIGSQRIEHNWVTGDTYETNLFLVYSSVDFNAYADSCNYHRQDRTISITQKNFIVLFCIKPSTHS